MRRFVLALYALVLAGCGSRPPPPPASTAGVLAPTAPPAAAYGGSDAKPGPHGEALRQAVATEAVRLADQSKRPQPRLYNPLSAAAEALAVAGQGETPDAAAVDFAAGHFGLSAPIPSVMVMQGRGSPEDFVQQISPVLEQVLRRGRYNRLGVGVAPADGEQVIVLLLQEDAVALEPVPRTLPVGGSARITGRFTGGYDDAQVLATGADGQVSHLQKGGDRFDTTFQCTGEGRHRVEVMGTGPLGPAVLANFSVYCGAPPPIRLAITLGGGADVGQDDAERALLDRVNLERKQQDLPLLTWDDDLAEVARDHSEDMRKHGFVGHISPTTGGPGDRIKAAGIIAGTIEENVGVGPSPEAVHTGLMESPAHRSAILSRTATKLGIGVERRPRQGMVDYFATQLFAGPPAPVDPVAARAKVESQLAPRHAPDPGLQRVAQSLAEDLAQGRLDPEDTQSATQKRLQDQNVTLRTLAALASVGPAPDTLMKDPLLTRDDLPRYGLGIAEGKQAGYPALFTVILLGR